MSPEPENLVLQHLRDMRAEMADMRAEMGPLRADVASDFVDLRRAVIEQHLDLPPLDAH